MVIILILTRTYEWLRKHYHDKHYLCEEGSCINEQFTSVFRTSIDLQGNFLLKHLNYNFICCKIEYNNYVNALKLFIFFF